MVLTHITVRKNCYYLHVQSPNEHLDTSMLLPGSNYQSLPFILSTLAKEICGTSSLSPTHTTLKITNTHTHTNSSSHRHKYRWEQANPVARVWKTCLKIYWFCDSVQWCQWCRNSTLQLSRCGLHLLLIRTFSWSKSSNLCKRGFSLESDDFQTKIQV